MPNPVAKKPPRNEADGEDTLADITTMAFVHSRFWNNPNAYSCNRHPARAKLPGHNCERLPISEKPTVMTSSLADSTPAGHLMALLAFGSADCYYPTV
jgi:hypothetical protein